MKIVVVSGSIRWKTVDSIHSHVVSRTASESASSLFLRRSSPMGLAQKQPLSTVEEYLALERQSEERHEYLDGCVREFGQHRVLRRETRGVEHRVLQVDEKLVASVR